jgi:hypothetical protein
MLTSGCVRPLEGRTMPRYLKAFIQRPLRKSETIPKPSGRIGRLALIMGTSSLRGLRKVKLRLRRRKA